MINKTQVLFIFKVNPDLKEYISICLKDEDGIELIFPEDPVPEKLNKYSANVQIMVGWRPDPEMLRQATQLGLFINPGVGVRHHIELFREINETRKLILCNGHGNDYFVAQHTVAMLLSMMNRIVPHHKWMSEGKWRLGDDEAASLPLKGKKLALLGYGHINQYVHQFLQHFEPEFYLLKKHQWDLYSTPTIPYEALYKDEDLDDFLRGKDILIIAIPETEKTEGLITAERLRLLKQGALLVNVARGKIVCEESLYNALKEGYLGGAAIDVWYDYKPEPDEEGRKFPFAFPFQEFDNVLLSPHRAASPFDDLERWDDVIENIRRYSSEEPDLLNVVDINEGY